MSDRILILDDADATAYVAARIQERQEQIKRNEANRKLVRKLAELPPQAAAVQVLRDKLAEAEAAVATKMTAKAAHHDACKAKHNATATYAEEVFDHGQGRILLREYPEMKVQGRPHVVRERRDLNDADAAAAAQAYADGCTARDLATNVQRQIAQYQEAHPVNIMPGQTLPADPTLDALKAALAGYVAQEQTANDALGAIISKALAGWQGSYRHDVEDGSVVLLDPPNS